MSTAISNDSLNSKPAFRVASDGTSPLDASNWSTRLLMPVMPASPTSLRVRTSLKRNSTQQRCGEIPRAAGHELSRSAHDGLPANRQTGFSAATVAGMHRWVGFGVVADNLINIATFTNARANA
jgi:hypothetical protein